MLLTAPCAEAEVSARGVPNDVSSTFEDDINAPINNADDKPCWHTEYAIISMQHKILRRKACDSAQYSNSNKQPHLPLRTVCSKTGRNEQARDATRPGDEGIAIWARAALASSY
jgi:hypothetical protein